MFNRGDLDGLAQIFAKDAVWHTGGRGRLSGVKQGRDAAFAYSRQLGELSAARFKPMYMK